MVCRCGAIKVREAVVGSNSISHSPGGVDVLRWSGTQAATAPGDIGLDNPTGRPSCFIGGSAQPLAALSDIIPGPPAPAKRIVEFPETIISPIVLPATSRVFITLPLAAATTYTLTSSAALVGFDWDGVSVVDFVLYWAPDNAASYTIATAPGPLGVKAATAGTAGAGNGDTTAREAGTNAAAFVTVAGDVGKIKRTVVHSLAAASAAAGDVCGFQMTFETPAGATASIILATIEYVPTT